MWIPKSILFKNLMSHVETEYNFQQNVVTLFQGINNDDDEQESNGSGKSVLIEAVAYALLGSGLKKTVDADLIRNNENTAYIQLKLNNSRTNQLLVIEREINRKSTSKLDIWLNGVDQKDKFATVPDGNKLIIDLIGISRKDLLNYYIISKEKYISFYSSSDTDKKDVISRFSKSDIIDGIDKIVQIDVDKFNDKIKELNDEIIEIDATIKVYNEQIEEERNTDREKLKSDQIQKYKDQNKISEEEIRNKEISISWYENYNTIITNHVKRYNRVIGEYNRQIELLKSVDYSKELGLIDKKEEGVKKEEQTKKTEKDTLEKELSETQGFLRELETGLKGLIKCPKCLHEFIPDEEFDAEEARESKPLIEEGIQELQTSIDNIKTNIQSFKTKYNDLDKEREVYRKKIKEFNDKKAAIELKIQRCNSGIKNINDPIKGLIKNNNTNIINLNNDIKKLNETIDKTKIALNKLQEEEIENEIVKIQNKIKESENYKEKILKQISDEETKRFKHEQWIFNFVKFKSFLANKSVKSIEGLSNLMLKKMNSNLQIQMEGYGLVNKGKELREKITAYILRNGFNEGSFFKFSGGERGRIEIATISGIQQLINFNSPNGGLDLLLIDEILESIDGKGIQSIAKSANKLNKTIGLITHVNIPVENDYRVVTIEKRNKISKII